MRHTIYGKLDYHGTAGPLMCWGPFMLTTQGPNAAGGKGGGQVRQGARERRGQMRWEVREEAKCGRGQGREGAKCGRG